MLLKYKQHLAADNTLKTATKRLYLNSAKLLYRQLYRQGTLPRDVSATVRGFTVSREHKADALTEQDVKRVFSYLAKQKDARLSAIFALLYFQGLRRGEVVRLKVEDYNPSKNAFSVIGKGRDDVESVDLHTRTVESVNAYLESAGVAAGWLFPSARSESGHLSEVQLHRMVKAVHQALKIGSTVHAWRKAFTSVLIESGMDLITVSKFTRHKGTQMLDVYYNRVDKRRKIPVYERVFSESVQASCVTEANLPDERAESAFDGVP
jgi:integrase